MIIMERFYVFCFILFGAFVKECYPCFTYNETHSPGILKSGSSFYQECYCSDPKYTTKHLKWLDVNDQEIKQMGPGTKPKMYTDWQHRRLSLLIPNLSKLMSGNYKCVTKVDGKTYAITYQVEAYDPLYFFNTDETQNVIFGRDSLISCEARGDDRPLISWHKGLDEFTEIVNSDKYEINTKGLVLKNVTHEDEGIYKCTASVLKTGEEVDRYIKVEVMTAPTIQELVAKPEQTVVLGESLKIECKADGFPLPKYIWNKTTETVPSEGRNISWTQDMNVIVFDEVGSEDRGIYECIAQNKAGEVRRQINIEVLTPPVITEFRNVTVDEGSETRITCKAVGRPRPEITMMYESELSEADTSLPYDEKKTGDNESEFHLTFKKVNRSHEGYYYCNASNDVTHVIESMYMRVYYKPTFKLPVDTIWAWPGKAVNLSCEHVSNPPAKLEWSYQGISNEIPTVDRSEANLLLNAHLSKMDDLYIPINTTDKSGFGTYECKAKNNLGEGTKVITVKEGFKPTVITRINITELTATSATFFIETPEYIGPPMIGLTAEYDQANNYEVTNIHLNRTWAVDRPYKLDKLKPKTRYNIRFAAINDVGTGPFNNVIEFETPEKSIPEPLSWDLETIEIPSTDNPVLKLKPPGDNGAPIDYYAIKYCPVDNEGEFNLSSCIEHKVSPNPEAEIELNHLDFNKTYRLELIAHNSEGNSTPTSIYLRMPEPLVNQAGLLSGGTIVTISVVMVVLCFLVLDFLLFLTRRQGMIAICFIKKDQKSEDPLVTRDKKGLLKDNGEAPDESAKGPDNGHKHFEYNKNTGVITGKHSAV